MSTRRVVVVGAGVGGLVAALSLARQGVAVTLVEKESVPGGKMRRIEVGGAGIDSGPTVFTMRWIFEAIFADAGESLEAHLKLTPLALLARHAWGPQQRLDLFADRAASIDAVGRFAGADEARRFAGFCDQAARVFVLRLVHNP